MKKDQVRIGGLYKAKVSDQLVTVRIDSVNHHGGWNATNTATGRHIHIRSPQRLRAEVGRKKATEAPGPDVMPSVSITTDQSVPQPDQRQEKAEAAQPRRLSALNAAAEVLKAEGRPMRAQELIAAMAEQGLWAGPGHGTL